MPTAGSSLGGVLTLESRHRSPDNGKTSALQGPGLVPCDLQESVCLKGWLQLSQAGA
jgi:hypothetical protein